MYAIVAAARADHPEEARTQLERARVALVGTAPGLVAFSNEEGRRAWPDQACAEGRPGQVPE